MIVLISYIYLLKLSWTIKCQFLGMWSIQVVLDELFAVQMQHFCCSYSLFIRSVSGEIQFYDVVLCSSTSIRCLGRAVLLLLWPLLNVSITSFT